MFRRIADVSQFAILQWQKQTTTLQTVYDILSCFNSFSHLTRLSIFLWCHDVFAGNISLCPERVRNDTHHYSDSFLGQYGKYCFQYLDTETQWGNALRYCKGIYNGDLIHITSEEEQDFFVTFLHAHHVTQSVWIGLTDSTHEGAEDEGQWIWTSGSLIGFSFLNMCIQNHLYYTWKCKDFHPLFCHLVCRVV